jgi:hypothetical protein
MRVVRTMELTRQSKGRIYEVILNMGMSPASSHRGTKRLRFSAARGRASTESCDAIFRAVRRTRIGQKIGKKIQNKLRKRLLVLICPSATKKGGCEGLVKSVLERFAEV